MEDYEEDFESNNEENNQKRIANEVEYEEEISLEKRSSDNSGFIEETIENSTKMEEKLTKNLGKSSNLQSQFKGNQKKENKINEVKAQDKNSRNDKIQNTHQSKCMHQENNQQSQKKIKESPKVIQSKNVNKTNQNNQRDLSNMNSNSNQRIQLTENDVSHQSQQSEMNESINQKSPQQESYSENFEESPRSQDESLQDLKGKSQKNNEFKQQKEKDNLAVKNPQQQLVNHNQNLQSSADYSEQFDDTSFEKISNLYQNDKNSKQVKNQPQQSQNAKENEYAIFENQKQIDKKQQLFSDQQQNKAKQQTDAKKPEKGKVTKEDFKSPSNKSNYEAQKTAAVTQSVNLKGKGQYEESNYLNNKENSIQQSNEYNSSFEDQEEASFHQPKQQKQKTQKIVLKNNNVQSQLLTNEDLNQNIPTSKSVKQIQQDKPLRNQKVSQSCEKSIVQNAIGQDLDVKQQIKFYTQENQALKNQLRQLVNQIDNAFDKENKVLSKNLKSADRTRNVSNEVRQKEKQINTLIVEKSKVEERLQLLKDPIYQHKMMVQIKNKESKIQQLTQSIAKLKTETQKKTFQLSRNHQYPEEEGKQIVEMNNEITAIYEKIESLKKRMGKQFYQSIQDKIEELETKQNKLQVLAQHFQIYEDKIQDNKEWDMLLKQKEVISKQIQALEKKNKKEAKESEYYLRSLQQTFVNYQDQISEKEIELDTLQKEIQDLCQRMQGSQFNRIINQINVLENKQNQQDQKSIRSQQSSRQKERMKQKSQSNQSLTPKYKELKTHKKQAVRRDKKLSINEKNDFDKVERQSLSQTISPNILISKQSHQVKESKTIEQHVKNQNSDQSRQSQNVQEKQENQKVNKQVQIKSNNKKTEEQKTQTNQKQGESIKQKQEIKETQAVDQDKSKNVNQVQQNTKIADQNSNQQSQQQEQVQNAQKIQQVQQSSLTRPNLRKKRDNKTQFQTIAEQSIEESQAETAKIPLNTNVQQQNNAQTFQQEKVIQNQQQPTQKQNDTSEKPFQKQNAQFQLPIQKQNVTSEQPKESQRQSSISQVQQQKEENKVNQNTVPITESQKQNEQIPLIPTMRSRRQLQKQDIQQSPQSRISTEANQNQANATPFITSPQINQTKSDINVNQAEKQSSQFQNKPQNLNIQQSSLPKETSPRYFGNQSAINTMPYQNPQQKDNISIQNTSTSQIKSERNRSHLLQDQNQQLNNQQPENNFNI